MPTKVHNAFDRDALHRILWRRTDHFGRLRLNLMALAEELGVNYPNLSVIVTSMTQEGRLHVIGGHTYRRKTYRVEDPEAWARLKDGTPGSDRGSLE